MQWNRSHWRGKDRRAGRHAGRLRVERLEDRQLLAVLTVTSTNDSGAGSLRDALMTANGNGETDIIKFNIPGSGIHTITPATPLPVITEALTIDGMTQSGATSTSPTIELNGTSAGTSANGLDITAGNSTIRGLIINRFDASGIKISNTGGNLLEGNFIGVNSTGTTPAANKFDGITILNSPNNTIGGTTSGRETSSRETPVTGSTSPARRP